MKYKLGTPLRFRSPFSRRIMVSKVTQWAGFRVVKEIIPAEERTMASGVIWRRPEETRYIQLHAIEEVEVITDKEYFLHELKNGID